MNERPDSINYYVVAIVSIALLGIIVSALIPMHGGDMPAWKIAMVSCVSFITTGMLVMSIIKMKSYIGKSIFCIPMLFMGCISIAFTYVLYETITG